MKNCFKYTLILAAAVSAAACTRNFQEYNTDPYGATEEELARDGYNVKSALLGLADGIIALDVNTTQFTEALLGGPLAGYLADANAGFNQNSIGRLNPPNNWTKVLMEDFPSRIYPNLRQLKQVTSNETILAVGNVIKVAGMHRIADTYGPMPYSKITDDGSLQVPFDSQETVYKTMIGELDAAIEVLTRNRTNNFSASSDIIYGGNVEKWCRYANSLKLRLAMRMSYADPAYAQQKAEEVAAHEIGAMASADDIAQLLAFGNDGNPLYVAVNYNRVSTHDDGSACITTGDSHADTFNQRHTRFVVKAHVKAAAGYSDFDGDTFYVFDLPVLVANNIYRITSIKLTMLGKDNDDKDDDLQAGKIQPTITVDPWNGTTNLTYEF
jgi:hypothetical protein